MLCMSLEIPPRDESPVIQPQDGRCSLAFLRCYDSSAYWTISTDRILFKNSASPTNRRIWALSPLPGNVSVIWCYFGCTPQPSTVSKGSAAFELDFVWEPSKETCWNIRVVIPLVIDKRTFALAANNIPSDCEAIGWWSWNWKMIHFLILKI